MSLLSIFSLAIALFVLAVTPGPGMFATISRSLASGFASSFGVIAGIVTGDIIFLVFAILGMSAISQAMGNFFVVVKIIGGAYLIFLGVKIWRSKPVSVQQTNDNKGTNYGNYFSGLVIIVAITVSIVLSSVLICYAYLANRARVFFSSTRSVKRLNKTAGGVMIATGVAIAATS